MPFLISQDRIEAALLTAVECDGQVFVAAYDVPDHWTAAWAGPWNGLALLNRVGLAARAEFLETLT